MTNAKSELITNPNLADPDAIYDALVRAHDGLSKTASDAMNARLVLILANHIGEPDVLWQALELARCTDAAHRRDRLAPKSPASSSSLSST